MKPIDPAEQAIDGAFNAIAARFDAEAETRNAARNAHDLLNRIERHEVYWCGFWEGFNQAKAALQ
jgi:hypothetical protein